MQFAAKTLDIGMSGGMAYNAAMDSAIIIGAGPAGASAALMLARAGHEVTLVEQHRFPRDKVCGECLSALGMQTLEEMGLAERIVAAGAVKLSRTVLYPADGEGLTLELPKAMWGLSRHALDPLILESAREAGAKIIQPARCEGMEFGTSPAVMVRDLASNEVMRLRPDWILLADGKGARMPDRPALTGDLGIKAHFTEVDGPRDAIELFGVTGHYVGVAPIEADAEGAPLGHAQTSRLSSLGMGSLLTARQGMAPLAHRAAAGKARWNVAFSVPAKRLQRHGNDLDELWAAMLLENRRLAERFAGARRMGGWLAAPLPRFGVARRWPAGVIPLGNAAAAIEPIGGEGMGLALKSGLMAARMILARHSDVEAFADHLSQTRHRNVQASTSECRATKAFADDSSQTRHRNVELHADVEKLRGEFAGLWRMRRAACRGLARILSWPAVAGPVVELARGNERLARAVMGWMGK